MNKLLQLRNKEEKNDLNHFRRLIAYGIDWYLGGVIASLPIIIIYMSLHSDATSIPQNLTIFHSPYDLVAGSLSFLVSIFYYVVFPCIVFKGQTLGKKLLKIKIVNDNYQDASNKQIIIRQLIMILLVEGSIYGASNMLHQIISVATGFNFSSLYAYIGLAISAISAVLVLVLKSKRALHDVVSHTKVVYLESNQYRVLAKKTQKKLRREMKLANG